MRGRLALLCALAIALCYKAVWEVPEVRLQAIGVAWRGVHCCV